MVGPCGGINRSLFAQGVINYFSISARAYTMHMGDKIITVPPTRQCALFILGEAWKMMITIS